MFNAFQNHHTSSYSVCLECMKSVNYMCVCVSVRVSQSSSVMCVSENRVPWFQGAVCHSRVPPLSAASLRDVLGSLILSIVGGIYPRSLCSLAPSARCVSPPPLTPSPCPPLLTACAQNILEKTKQNPVQMTRRSSALDPC